MSSLSCKVFALIVLLTAGLLSVVEAQSPASTSDWETLRPEKEVFSVLMPKGSTFESGTESYHKMDLKTRYYLSTSQGGPVIAVASFAGIPSNPQLYTDLQRFNSYVDAFKTLFPPKLKGKTAPVKLTLVGEKSFYGHPGREYRMSIGNVSGTVQAVATRRRFYALVYLSGKKDEAVQEQFLSSFVLPEKGAEPPPTVAAQNPTTPPESPQRPNKTPAEDAASDVATAGAEGDTKPDAAAGANAQPGKKRPISGGVLNGKAIVLPKPDYPADAKTAGAAGPVAVQVTVDEMGSVIEAKAVSGHPLLQQPSVNAALQARFSPTSLMGEPVKVTGLIMYNFARQP